MSLKAIHLLFIAASILLSLGVGFGSLFHFFREGGIGALTLGIIGIAGGFGLYTYGKSALKKLRKFGLV